MGPQCASSYYLREEILLREVQQDSGQILNDESLQKPVLHELGLNNMFRVIYGFFLFVCFIFDWFVCLFVLTLLLQIKFISNFICGKWRQTIKPARFQINPNYVQVQMHQQSLDMQLDS